ncbi:hypothetical protein JCGZ_18391 [Jatropha curcas]|uniref:Uncharacterized protein n=1 Tax=Jatropha curcas TaxID=180498 RepID=A0A067K1G9_JATCU|nr:hypothetical protein JCGZ_18391 [Jatropha curcas]
MAVHRSYSHTTLDIRIFRQLLNDLSWDKDIVAVWRGSAATDHLAAFVHSAYAVFLRTQLLVHVPPPAEFDPFAEAEDLDRGKGAAQQQQHGKHLRRGSESRASDATIVVGTPEHGPGASFSFILDRTCQPTQGMLEMHIVSLYQMHLSIDDYNKVCHLYEAVRLKLAVARLSDEHVSRVDMAPPAGRGRGMQRGEHVGHRDGCRPLIVEETEESGSEDSEETTSNMS